MRPRPNATSDGNTNTARGDDASDGHAGVRRLARGSGVLGALAGLAGALYMLGAFGPVSCWTSRASTSSGVTTVERGCTAGIDYLFGAGGNAPVLYFWSMALLLLVALGTAASWTGSVGTTWVVAILCGVVTVIGVFSIGWFFLVPALAYLTAAIALTVKGSRDGGRSNTTF